MFTCPVRPNLNIQNNCLQWSRNEKSIQAEEALDGIHVVRTSEPEDRFSPEDTVRVNKNLWQVENVFRTLKGLDLMVRPIHHRLSDRVRVHILLCMLAYYVEWHLRKAWAALLFHDHELDNNRALRDPVASAETSPAAKRKKATKLTPEGVPVHSFRTLLADLATRCKNSCLPKQAKFDTPIELITKPSPLQQHALQLIRMYPVTGI